MSNTSGGLPGSQGMVGYASPHAIRNSPLHSSLRRNSPQLAHVRNSPVPATSSPYHTPSHHPPHSPVPHHQYPPHSPASHSITYSPSFQHTHMSSMHHPPNSPGQLSHSSFRMPAASHQGSPPQPPQTLALAHTASPSVSLRQRALQQTHPPASPQLNGASTSGDSPLRRLQGGGAVARLQDSPRLKDNSSHSSPSLKSANGQGSSNSSNKIKCVFIGDGAVGKTSLIISYTTNGYPNEYIPTAMDTYHAVVHVDDQPLTLELCDTPGQDDFDTLRPLVYPQADVFLLCFSVVLPSSFHNVREKWIPELRSHCGKVPVVLVGTQSDLREDGKTILQLRQNKEQPIQENEAKKLAQSLGCELYIECSSLTQKNLKEVFDNAIVSGLTQRRNRERKMNKKKKKLCILL